MGHTIVKDAAKSAAPKIKEREEVVLEAFGRAMASRPLDLSEVEKARNEVRDVGGDGMVVEASAVVGGFSLTTRVVDGTGRFADPKLMKFLSRMFFVKKNIKAIKYSALAGVAALVVALWMK